MALILCIDTATMVCSVALAENQKIIANIDSTEEKSHASQLGIYIDNLLKNAGIYLKQLDAVAISRGPGSFTGLRIGVSMAKGLCYGADIPLIAVDTLQAMAYGIVKLLKDFKPGMVNLDDSLYCPMIDARRMEVYTAIYDFNIKPVKDTEAKIIDEDSFGGYLKTKMMFFGGDGAAKCKNLINDKNAFFLENFAHSAIHMNSIAQDFFNAGKFEDIAYFEPYYLKNFIATVAKRKIF